MASVAQLQQAAREVEAGEAAQAEAGDDQQDTAAALVAEKRHQLAAAKCALREGEVEALKQLVLAPLFPDLVALVFALLPVDSRLRCREVSRGWCAFLADARHWRVLDLSRSSGVARRTIALLRTACERAQGTLRELDVSGWYREPVGEGEEELEDEQLLPVLRANADSLLELHAWTPVNSEDGSIAFTAGVEDLLVAAPRLRLLECDVCLEGEEARGPLPRILREPQFAPLRLRTVEINAKRVRSLDMSALAVWAAKQSAQLKSLTLIYLKLDSEPALDAVVYLANSQLQHLTLDACSLSPASLPALTRMLASRSLMDLRIDNARLLIGAAVPAFCNALRASRLVTLMLKSVSMWESLDDGLAVIAACTGHPTLRTLSISANNIDGHTSALVGHALAALISEGSTLEVLYVAGCGLDDAAIRLLFAAVAGSTRLRELDCSWNDDITAECAREAILPALQANASLRTLAFDDTDIPELVQAEELVRARVG